MLHLTQGSDPHAAVQQMAQAGGIVWCLGHGDAKLRKGNARALEIAHHQRAAVQAGEWERGGGLWVLVVVVVVEACRSPTPLQHDLL